MTRRRGWILQLFSTTLLLQSSTSFTSIPSYTSNLFRTRNNSPLYVGRKSIVLKSTATADASDINVSNSTIKAIPYPVLLWRFSRPHTLIGSALAIPSIHLLAATSFSSISTSMLYSILAALIPSLLMNVYITGLNQLTDVEIDKINKPNLPLASGDLSKSQGILIIVFCLIGSLAMGSLFGSLALNVTLWASALLGTVYSLPPFRLKRFPALAAFCIVVIRGMVINTGFYSHALSCSILSCLHHPKCFYSSLFFACFGIVIALMKDVPDVKGDAMFQINSLSVTLGPHTILRYMKGFLSFVFFTVSSSFVCMSVNGSGLLRGSRLAVAALALGMGWSVRREGRHVDARDSNHVYRYYMHLWKLFYLCYFALPLAR